MKLTDENVDLSIAVSKATKEKLIEYTQRDDEKIKVMYNFVDLEKFNLQNCKINSKELKTKLKITSDYFIVGFAARIIKRKGWLDLLLAFKSIENENIKLLISGVGPESRKL